MSDELRKEVHMRALSKSRNAKDLGEFTVVPLGFAVDLILEERLKARLEARIDTADKLALVASGQLGEFHDTVKFFQEYARQEEAELKKLESRN